ncbi:MAG: acyl-CoA mutase large subunit family protein [Bacteroidetes bacterium]|nr:acyl-CoA mutase large subunit family protein [Bacteroidota bacterium]
MSNDKLFKDFPPVLAGQLKKRILKDLNGDEYGTVLWRTMDELIFEPFYTIEDLEQSEIKNHKPGVHPFLRGNQKAGNEWEIRQDVKVSDSLSANKKALDILNKGITSIGFITDSAEINELLKDVLIEYLEINFINSQRSQEILKNLILISEERNLNPLQLKGSVNYEPLAEMLSKGNLENTWEAQSALIAQELIEGGFTFFRGINISGDIFHNAGASIVQELAFTLAQGNEYLVSLTNKFNIDQIAPVLQFTYSTGSSYLMEIAKIRAARLLWAKIIEQYKPQHDCTSATYIHCKTSEYTLTVADAYNNLLRATTQTMSAAIAGANAISVSPFDAATKDPEEFSERLARNIQIICAEEAFLNKVADPAGGSYYLEKLTESIAQAAWDLFRVIESKGGYIAACQEGFIQNEIEETAKHRKQALSDGNEVMVGVNKYINKTEDISSFNKNQEAVLEKDCDFKVLRKVKAEEFLSQGTSSR